MVITLTQFDFKMPVAMPANDENGGYVSMDSWVAENFPTDYPPPIVAESTYSMGCTLRSIRGTYGVNFENNDRPVFMRGSWGVILSRNSNNNSQLAREVLSRWIRRRKITWVDPGTWFDRVSDVLWPEFLSFYQKSKRENNYKRSYLNRAGNFGIEDLLGKVSRCGDCARVLLNGCEEWVDGQDKIRALKSLQQADRKLERLERRIEKGKPTKYVSEILEIEA